MISTLVLKIYYKDSDTMDASMSNLSVWLETASACFSLAPPLTFNC